MSENQASPASEKTLVQRVEELLKQRPGIELYVEDIARALKIDGRRVRRALRKVRATLEDLVWYRDGAKIVYIYKPTEEQKEKIEKSKERKQKRERKRKLAEVLEEPEEETEKAEELAEIFEEEGSEEESAEDPLEDIEIELAES